MHCNLFNLGDFSLQSGADLLNAKFAFKTYGKLNANKDNVVVLPTFYTGKRTRNEGFLVTVGR